MQVLVMNSLVDAEKTEVAHLWAAVSFLAQISVLPGRQKFLHIFIWLAVIDT